MDDDFNTALAGSVMFGLAKEINIFQSKVTNDCDQQAVSAAKKAYYLIADILGILVLERDGKLEEQEGLVDQLMEIIIELRQQARQKKDWAMADAVRDRLGSIGIILEDSPQGVRWKKR